MSTSIPPVAKAMWLCDAVVEDPGSRKVSVLGAFNSIREVAAYPFQLPRLCIVALLSGGLGELTLQLDIVRDADQTLLYSMADRPIRFATRHSMVYACFRFEQFTFPAPGVYQIELYCQGQFIDDRMLVLPDVPE